jgi:DNA gyrase subunit A
MRLRTYDAAPFLLLATRRGLVKKTRLSEYDSNRTGGLIAINLRDDGNGTSAARDELVAAKLLGSDDDILLVSRRGQSLRFTATEDALRPMGRATSGVTGMKFRDDDELLSVAVVRAAGGSNGDGPAGDGAGGESAAEPREHVFVVFENGNAKRTHVQEYRVQSRGGLGIKVAASADKLGDLVGAVMVHDGDEVLVVMERGKVVRSVVDDVPVRGRNTQGVRFAKPDPGDAIIAITRNDEAAVDDDDTAPDDTAPHDTADADTAGDAAPRSVQDGVASDAAADQAEDGQSDS